MNQFDLAIVGGGPAGYTAAECAGKAGLSVVLFEKNKVGGVCLNEGCVPTKTLLYSAKIYDYTKHGKKYGIEIPEAEPQLKKIISRKKKVVRKLVMGVEQRVKGAGCEIVEGTAEIIDKNTIKCGDEEYKAANLILCCGSDTFIPPIPGVGEIDYWTHREALDNKDMPASLAIVGGGVIGMEFASFFSSMGVKVTVIEMLDKILGPMDRELSEMLRDEYAKRGIDFLLQTKVVGLRQDEEGFTVSYEDKEGQPGDVKAEKLLMSVGRRPVTQGYGLENLHLELVNGRSIKVDEHLQTSVPGVYVCGDLNGHSLLAHTAVREAEVAVRHIAGIKDEMSYKAIPGVVYTNPEIAGVGLTEDDADKQGIKYQVHRLPMAFSGRFVAENEGGNGICKVLTEEDGTILGVHIIGNPASELIVIAGMAIEDSRKLEDFKQYVFPHPTVGEIYREF